MEKKPMPEPSLDVVGYWTEVKLNILRDYSKAYATILTNQKSIKHFAYIDGFAGIGAHISKTTGQEIEGSASIALNLEPKFSHHHFIDMDGKRTARLQKLAEGRTDVTVYTGDCNSILVERVFPQCRYDEFRRAGKRERSVEGCAASRPWCSRLPRSSTQTALPHRSTERQNTSPGSCGRR